MGFELFCTHKKYDVLGWKYVNIGKYDQYIEARVRCEKCGKIFIKKIEGETCSVFAVVYDDKIGM